MRFRLQQRGNSTTAAAYQGIHRREHDKSVDQCKPKIIKAQLAPLRRAARGLSVGFARANLRAAVGLRAAILGVGHRRLAPVDVGRVSRSGGASARRARTPRARAALTLGHSSARCWCCKALRRAATRCSRPASCRGRNQRAAPRSDSRTSHRSSCCASSLGTCAGPLRPRPP